MINKMRRRKRIKLGEWYKVTHIVIREMAASPIERVKNNNHGELVYKCRTINYVCSGSIPQRYKCDKCNKNNCVCLWIGFLGTKIPKLKVKLLYEK